MRQLLLSIILVLVMVTPSDAIFVRFFTSLTGDVEGSIDNITCADVYGSGSATDDGVGVVITSAGAVSFYYFDQSATDATNAPDYIRCKTYTASGVWILASTVSGSGMDELADDATPELAGHLIVNGYEIQATGANDVVVQLGDNAGVQKLIVQDSDGATIFEVTSDGVQNPSDSPYATGIHNSDSENIWRIGTASGDKAADNAILKFYGFSNNALVDFLHFVGTSDGLTDTVQYQAPVIFKQGKGKAYENIEANNQSETIDDYICEYTWYIQDITGPDDTIEFELPAEVECQGISGYAKKFCFHWRGADTAGSDLIFLDPDDADKMIPPGATSITAGYKLKNDDVDKGDRLCIEGRVVSGTDYWIVTEFLGTLADWVTNGS